MDLHPDLMDLLGAFSSSGVEYLVVGGWAVSVHSEPRFTKYLDLLIGTDQENLERAAAALAAGREQDLRDLRALERTSR
jgi:hypothetical protein